MSHIKVLPVELQQVAEKELGEVPEEISKNLQNLRSWIEQQPHLNARLDEQFLIQYLRGCKYNLEKAKEKLDLFFTLKTKFPEFSNVTDVNDKKFRDIHNQGFGIPLPKPLNDNGARIFYLKFEGDIAKGLVDIEQMYSVVSALHEIILMDDPYACINGMVYIMDLKEANFNLVSKYTPTFIRKLVQFYEKSLPFRIKEVHMVNMPTIFHNVLNMMMPLFSQKLRQRIFTYGQNCDDLEKNIGKKYLPIDLGGENGCNKELIKNFDKKWLEYSDYFKENCNYGTNELLRPGGMIDFDSIYGLGGSFRKIEVD